MSESYNVDVIIGAKDEASSVLSKFTHLGAAGFGAMAKIGASAVSAVTGGVTGLAKSTLDIGVGFTSAMSEVSAISGATGTDLQLLEDTARKWGAATTFSATESADALKYMAMA